MIKFKKINRSEPYKYFEKFYKKALKEKQKNIEAILIASLSVKNNEVDARYVNLKYIRGEEFVFFSNYKSPKSIQFDSHNQITAVIYWPSIDTQIRMKSKIARIDKDESDAHFSKRTKEKNALAISSMQSEPIESYEEVKRNYNQVLDSKNPLKRPDYWGGYSFKPFYFEFWIGHDNRLNKRFAYTKIKETWTKKFLQP